ncbi:hypothetical protein GQ464_017810 [Rhodocaloribacter litoris]|uniref:hypothetical protein n=1 Tax=Rhodocaloribacter litoris TaxID=2558931 RepID=UPI0014208BFB|nr:hypothetical protein [Rhodocaloribacter litoris]QXD15231.1 hypothetical protein GQ464_017810 [Rhodocaloribacter litoris]
MGQQQLLLLVLGIVIVGLAVVVGIQAFSENQKKANADALVNDAIRIASDAQAWKLKPAAFGGGADATNWTGLTFQQLGYETTDDVNTYENLNGKFVMSDQTETTLTITATNTETGNQVVVEVSGTKPSDITTTVSNLTSSP